VRHELQLNWNEQPVHMFRELVELRHDEFATPESISQCMRVSEEFSVEAPRPDLSAWPVKALDQDQEPQASRNESGVLSRHRI
jgi:hypothetical protein